MLFFPADTSFAALIGSLARNDGKGIIFAFETDTLTQNFSKEWGNTTSLFRQAYEHEKYENIRKGEPGKPALHILTEPALSILLTGTPSQVSTLIPGTEDGLFSRFCFYRINLDPTWRSPFPTNNDGAAVPSFDLILTPSQGTAHRMYTAYNGPNMTTIKFDLTSDQKNRLDSHFIELSAKYQDNNDTNAIATIRRQGGVCFRLAGILTAVRAYENPGECLTCSDDDFNTAMGISDVFRNHAFNIARSLPGPHLNKLDSQKRVFFNNLPSEFNRKEAVEVGEALGIKENTVEKYLHDLQPKHLKKPEHNHYVKVE